MEQTIQNGVINQIYQTEKKLSQFFVIIVFRLYEHANGGIYQDNPQNNMTYVKQCKHTVITHKEMCKLISSVGRKYIHRTSKY